MNDGERERSRRSLMRELRRRKHELERINPLEDPDRFSRGFEAILELEVALRDHPDTPRS